MSDKKTVDDKLSEALDIKYETEQKEEPSDLVKKVDSLPLSKEKLDKDMSKDYDQVRRNLKELIGVGRDAIDGILNVAVDSDAPRAYEVASQMIKAVAEMNKDLMGLHDQVKTIKKEDITVNHNTTNSLYVGSTTDLQDLINQSRSAKKALNHDIIDVEVEENDQ